MDDPVPAPPSRRGDDGPGHHHPLSQDTGGQHPHSLPPMNTAYPPMSSGPKDDPRREDHEPAARKMDVDEDYDDDSSDKDQKRGVGAMGGHSHDRTSPPTNNSMHATNGMTNGLTKADAQVAGTEDYESFRITA